MDSDSDIDIFENLLNEIDDDLDINEIENNINKLCDRDIFFEEYRKNIIEIKNPRKKTDIEIMDKIHSKIKKQIQIKEIEKEKRKEMERKKTDITISNADKLRNLYEINNIPDPTCLDTLINNMNKKKYK